MDYQHSETMSNTFGGNNYSNDCNNMSIDQRYENGQTNNTTSMDNVSTLMNQMGVGETPITNTLFYQTL